ncbi:hypothetical protein [Spiroplasma melliferum]|nr:hypothetical protein [Spiroplasma melliferum]ELL44975.1 putative transmembrane protein [Spiroplasma melliferum IPMB4A]
MKKWKKLIYTINTALILLVIFLLSFILWILYTIYLPVNVPTKINPEPLVKLIPKPPVKVIPKVPPKPGKNNINLEYNYAPNSTWFYQRDYNGLWINKHQATYLEKNLTNAFLMQAQDVDLPFYEQEVFNSYEELSNFWYAETKQGWQQVINTFCPDYQAELKTLLVKFYNFISNIWSKDIVKEFVRILRINNNGGPVVGSTYREGFKQVIALERNILLCSHKINGFNSWRNGWWSSGEIFNVIFHELGHTIDINFSRQVNVIEEIKVFLANKIENGQDLTPEQILNLFHLSSYSFNNLGDFVAEGFVYWFLASDALKIKAWELWHEFLTLYLPKLIK